MSRARAQARSTAAVDARRVLPGTRLLSHAWLRWTILGLGTAALLPEMVITLVGERAPAGLGWILANAAPIAVAGVVVRRRPQHLLAGWVSLAGLGPVAQLAQSALGGLADGTSTVTVAWLVLAYQELTLVNTIGLAMVVGLFADGVVRRRSEQVVLSSLWVLLIVPPLLMLIAPTVPLPFYFDVEPVGNPLFLGAVEIGPGVAATVLDYLSLLVLLAAGALLVARYRRADLEQRRPVRWLLVPAVVFAVALVTQLLIGDGEPRWLISAMWVLTGLALPVAIGLGLLQPAGLDVDRVLRQSLVYALLWLAIAAAYVGLGAAVGVAAGQRLSIGWAVTLTMVAALAFQPARAWLGRLADRWVFGSRPDPSQAVARLGAALADTYDLKTLLPLIESTVRDGLELEWVRVRLDPDTAPAATAEDSPVSVLDVPIVLDGSQVGVIACGPAVSGRLTDADRAVVETFAGQAALAVRNVRLARALAAHAEELADSRARLVRAQDAERRRIERNIHDGVQQELVALIGLAGRARHEAARDAAAVAEDLAALQHGLQRVLSDLRELAQGIHPSVLTDRGLLTAVETLAARHPVPVTVRADPALRDLRLPDEVEGAGYFTVAESLANSLKHAAARQVDVSLRRVNGSLVVAVRDDGTGIPPTGRMGNGLAGLAARVESAGGRLDVTGGPGQGTTVAATLSVPDGDP